MGLQRTSFSLVSRVGDAIALQHARELNGWAERLGISERSSPIQSMLWAYDTKEPVGRHRRPAGWERSSPLRSMRLYYNTRMGGRRMGKTKGGERVVRKRNEEGEKRAGWEEILQPAH